MLYRLGFEKNEDMYPIVATGAAKYDVVCPSDYIIQKMIDEELLLPLNYDNIPNIVNIDPEYLKSAENFDPGNLYSVPYCWGTVGILYNKTMVDEPIDNWGVLFEEKYSQEILMINSVHDKMIGEEAAIGVIYSGEAIYTQRENEDIRNSKIAFPGSDVLGRCETFVFG